MKRILAFSALAIILAVAFGNNLISLLSGVPVNCLDGIDAKKTGISKNSKSITESRINNVFNFQLLPIDRTISIDEHLVIELEELWVEQHWAYECLDSGIYAIPANGQQLLMKVSNYDSLTNKLSLITLDEQTPCACSGVLRFNYPNDLTPLVLRTFDSTGKPIDSVKIK